MVRNQRGIFVEGCVRSGHLTLAFIFRLGTYPLGYSRSAFTHQLPSSQI
jgi:hypothetical protein